MAKYRGAAGSSGSAAASKRYTASQPVLGGRRELAEVNQRTGAAAKLLAHQVHGQRVRGVEADVEAACPGLPVADVGAHDGAAFRRVDRPQEMPQLVDQHFQPFRLGDLVAPLADEDVRAEGAARAAHVLARRGAPGTGR